MIHGHSSPHWESLSPLRVPVTLLSCMLARWPPREAAALYVCFLSVALNVILSLRGQCAVALRPRENKTNHSTLEGKDVFQRWLHMFKLPFKSSVNRNKQKLSILNALHLAHPSVGPSAPPLTPLCRGPQQPGVGLRVWGTCVNRAQGQGGPRTLKRRCVWGVSTRMTSV